MRMYLPVAHLLGLAKFHQPAITLLKDVKEHKVPICARKHSAHMIPGIQAADTN